MEGRIILIRHAETDRNRTHYAGREDVPLNVHGLRQARHLAAALDGETVSAIFCSPLSRAIATAAPLAEKRGMEVTLRDALLEIDFGTLQGTEKARHDLSLRKHHREQPIPGGESLRDVWFRLRPLGVELLRLMRDGGIPVVVGHYWSNRLLADMLAGRTFEHALTKDGYKPENASAYALAFDEGGGELRCTGALWLHRPSEFTVVPGDVRLP